MRHVLLFLISLTPLVSSAASLRVFVSVVPQQTFVERLGGDVIEVEALVKPGFSPHTYEPTPSQIARLADADLFVGIGLPFEAAWTARMRAANPSIRIVDLSAGIKRRQIEAHEDDAEHQKPDGLAASATGDSESRGDGAGSESDPHLWTSPVLVSRMLIPLAAALTDLDPAHASDYAARLASFQADLAALDREIRATLSHLKQRRFMVFHPAWGYFADAYGLSQIPIEKDGKEPGPRSLGALIEQAHRERVKVIFVQPQFSRKAAEQVARGIGGRVDVIDNLSPDYLGNLRRVARSIAAAGS